MVSLAAQRVALLWSSALRNLGCFYPSIYLSIYLFIYLSIYLSVYLAILCIPVVPHKAVAEVSDEETYRRGWLL